MKTKWYLGWNSIICPTVQGKLSFRKLSKQSMVVLPWQFHQLDKTQHLHFLTVLFFIRFSYFEMRSLWWWKLNTAIKFSSFNIQHCMLLYERNKKENLLKNLSSGRCWVLSRLSTIMTVGLLYVHCHAVLWHWHKCIIAMWLLYNFSIFTMYHIIVAIGLIIQQLLLNVLFSLAKAVFTSYLLHQFSHVFKLSQDFLH